MTEDSNLELEEKRKSAIEKQEEIKETNKVIEDTSP